jgi:septal ring factor EnvC (AmiA/AmiB activator)
VLAAPAGAESDSQAKLRQLRARLDTLQQELNATRGRRDAVREEVHELERRIGTLLPAIKQLDRRLRAENEQLGKLKARARAERQSLATHRNALARQVRAAYALGPQEGLKLLLSQEEPTQMARLVGYHRYIQQARARHIEDIHESLDRLARLESETQARASEIGTLRDSRLAQKTALEQTARRRAELLASLSRTVRNRQQEVERLQADRVRLEQLVKEIKPLLRELPPIPSGARFGALAGRLPLPARGTVVARFNEPKPLGDMRWRGVFLAAREGEPVKAVARGRVAYADALRGFGLLLILDHGDGYMTLYGHNQGLFKEVGDWVEAGEPVAQVGNTGDAPRPGLYFEIRHHGEPHDPLRWCAANTR